MPDVLGASGPTRSRGDVLEAAGTHLKDTTALLAPGRVAGTPHLDAAARHAHKALDAGRDRCRDPALEVLLHAAGTDQISDALDRVGLDDEVERVAVVPLEADDGIDDFLEAIGFRPDDGVLDVDPDRAVRLAAERGHEASPDDALDWLLEDAALVQLA